MTDIYFSDFTVTSVDGAYRLEAASPANEEGAEQRRMFGHQRDFVYTVFEQQSGAQVWSRRQADGELSPSEAFVGPDGSVVIRTHGHINAGLVVLSAQGQMLADIDVIEGVFGGRENLEDSVEVRWTSAGPYWATGHISMFFEADGRHVFCVRTPFGRKILVDMSTGALLEPSEQMARLADQAIAAEVLRQSSEPAPAAIRAGGQIDEDDDEVLNWLMGALPWAIAAGQLGLAQTEPALRVLEACWYGDTATGAGPLNGRRGGFGPWALETCTARLIPHLSLKRLGLVPVVSPGYRFYKDAEIRDFPSPPDRPLRLTRLGERKKPLVLLSYLGVPDFIYTTWSPETRVHTDVWEYDLVEGDGIETVRLTFSNKGRVARNERIAPAPWLSDPYRERELLR